VTHRHIDDAAVDQAIAAVREVHAGIDPTPLVPAKAGTQGDY
jgi:hypothetical protein